MERSTCRPAAASSRIRSPRPNGRRRRARRGRCCAPPKWRSPDSTPGWIEPHGRGTRKVSAHQSGKLGEAEALYRLVLEKAPRHTGALTLLGTLQAQLRNLEEAARLFEI